MSEPTLDDLRVPCEHGRYEEHRFLSPGGDPESSIAYRDCPGGTPAEFDRIAREQGYVKREHAFLGQGGPEMWISDPGGSISVCDEMGPMEHVRPLVVGDLERLGYVKRPVCGDCDGLGEDLSTSDCEGPPCPSCGGTGFGRLVSADEVLGSMGQVRFKEWAKANGYVNAALVRGIRLEALRDAVEDYAGWGMLDSADQALAVDFIRQVLAAIDQEAT